RVRPAPRRALHRRRDAAHAAAPPRPGGGGRLPGGDVAGPVVDRAACRSVSCPREAARGQTRVEADARGGGREGRRTRGEADVRGSGRAGKRTRGEAPRQGKGRPVITA